MTLKTFLSNLIVLIALILCIFSAHLFGQKIRTGKNAPDASYVRDNIEEAKIVRKRKVEAEKVSFSQKPSANQISGLEKLAFVLINRKRAETGLPPLAWNDEVAKIARIHSENMGQLNFFGHRGTDGKMVDGRADAAGLTSWTLIGENIAYNRGYKDPVETAVEKWMLSPTHRENLLDSRWKESAIGIAVTENGTYYFTQVFIKRK